ncbi:hypothetical protein [Cognatiluteimonas profundi]|uniref:hypothetical protein n=1 Tax=Cognatiluteimonas profundi TaxID=2594501 RepID=UPI00131DD2B9|nr:hypothetical protein [Lysobacter profundi]
MNAFATLVYVVLSMFGLDLGSHVTVDRIHADGTDTLYSKVVAQPTVTRFECLRSASGQCYYTLYPRDCVPTPAPASASTSKRDRDCQSTPVERFAVATGGSRQVTTVSDLRVCVGADARSVGPDCDRPAAVATR